MLRGIESSAPTLAKNEGMGQPPSEPTEDRWIAL